MTETFCSQVKQEDLEYQLLSPISTSSPGGMIRSNGPRIIKVTPSTLANSKLMMNDHEYFSTPITPSTPSSQNHTIMVHHQGSSSSASGPAVARRRLNLDSAALVDRDGFKTPIKGTKRKADFSSPSPKKCKDFVRLIKIRLKLN